MIVIRVITICLISAGPPAPALTVCSWAGLDYTIDNKERTLYFETFLRWVGAFRSLNNLKLRIIIGGLFNVDLKVIQVGNISQNKYFSTSHCEVLEIPRHCPPAVRQQTKPQRKAGAEVQFHLHEGQSEGIEMESYQPGLRYWRSLSGPGAQR